VTAAAKPPEARSVLSSVRIVGRSTARPFSLANEERLRRCFARLGVNDVGAIEQGLPQAGDLWLVRGDWLFDESVLAGLLRRRNFVLAVERGGRRHAVAAGVPAAQAGEVVAASSIDSSELDVDLCQRLGFDIVDLDAVGNAYRGNLRNRVPPFVLPLDHMALHDIEWHMFMASYKGVTDIVTRHLWPRPAMLVTRWCAAGGVSPNAVTFASFLCVVAATVLFATGWYWIGLVFAWLMCFLDTVDGKLARVTITSSKWGNVFDHGTDLVHPPFWWFAWYWGLATLPFAPAPGVGAATAIVLAGYLLGRAQEGIFLWTFGIEMHVWRKLDSVFRGFTARRNPNLILFTLGTALGRPDWALIMVAAWTVASFAFHCVRIAQAFVERGRGRRIVSWLAIGEAPAGA